jgi:hypothetical protein
MSRFRAFVEIFCIESFSLLVWFACIVEKWEFLSALVFLWVGHAASCFCHCGV